MSFRPLHYTRPHVCRVLPKDGRWREARRLKERHWIGVSTEATLKRRQKIGKKNKMNWFGIYTLREAQ